MDIVILNNSIKQVVNSYCVGKIKGMNHAQINITNGSFFNEQLYSMISLLVSIEERLLMRKCSNMENYGLISARKGLTKIAEQALKESYNIIQSSFSSTCAKQISETFYESAAAYLDYCKLDYDSAKTRINKAISIDIGLEKDFGLNILAVHRWQLVYNLMRIEKRIGNYDILFHSGVRFLNQLEEEIIGNTSGFMDSNTLTTDKLELINRMFVQIISELSLALIKVDNEKKISYFQSIVKHTRDVNNPPCSFFPLSHQWIQTKSAYLNNDLLTFLDYSAKLLRHGKGKLSLLWYSSIFDLFTTCVLINSKESKNLKNIIMEDLCKFNDIPKEIRSQFLLYK